MPFDITAFQTNLQTYGYSSANKFDVNINLPSIFTSTGTSLSGLPDILKFRAQNVNLPSIAFMNTESNRYGMGPVIKQPYNAVYGDIQTSFITDKQGLIYEFFFIWMNAIYNFSETSSNSSASGNISIPVNGTATNYSAPTYTTRYEDDIVAPSIDINVYDNTGKTIQTVSAYRAKPIAFTTIPLAWDQTDTLLKCNVTFTYREWTVTFPT